VDPLRIPLQVPAAFCQAALAIVHGVEDLDQPREGILANTFVRRSCNRAPEGFGGRLVGVLRVHAKSTEFERRNAHSLVIRKLL